MPVIYDDAAWPLPTLRMIGRMTRAEEDEFIESAMLPPQRHEPYAGIIDLLEASTPSVRFLRKQATAMKRHEDELARYCLGVAFVARSAMMRGAIRAVLHLQTLPSPSLVVATMEEARQWAQERLPNPAT